jgi:hypothetical protein
MSGVTDLVALLASMEPVLVPGEFVYATVEGDPASWVHLAPIGTFREAEGLTLVLPVEAAERLTTSAPMRMITLTVHSSLEAVGLTAAISAALTAENISANVVAAYYHDHVFVPAQDAERALAALKALLRPA